MMSRALTWCSIYFAVVFMAAAQEDAEASLTEIATERRVIYTGTDEEVQPVSSEYAKNGGSFCEDKPPEATGFEIYTQEGFIGFASCTELAQKCHGWINSTRIQTACPASCFICDPNQNHVHNGPPCYDAVSTGVKFVHGPAATCSDLSNYCNHSTLWHHVQAACRLTCGLCEAHVGHTSEACRDLNSDDEPEFMISGQLASCTDLQDFCTADATNKQAHLVRHKCPRTCGACPELTTTSHWLLTTPDPASQEASFNSGQQSSDCDRRRRWGFCSTRRRRNM
jgi:hypothetical protein